MAAAVKEAPPSPVSVAAKTAAQANALAAMANVAAPQQKLTAAMASAKAAAEVKAPEVVVKKEPEIDIEEARFWMKQTVVYVSLFATVIAMACAHHAGKSFLSTAMCGATAAILTGIAGTVVAQLSLPQVVAEQPAEEAQGN